MEEVCKNLNVEVRKGPKGPTLKGMPKDVENARNVIENFFKEKERERQETVIARLVQWYYLEVTKC